MARAPKYQYSIFCDDIRNEVGNKASYMGVYGKNILIPKTPFVFPQLCAVIVYDNLRAGDSFSITAKDPGGKILGKPLNHSVPGEAKGKVDLMMSARFAPVKINKEGPIQITIVFNDDPSTAKEIQIPIQIRK